AQHATGMGQTVMQRQRGAPGATEQGPVHDAEMAPQGFHVGEQVIEGVVVEAGIGRRTTGTALVKQDDAPVRRIEKTALYRAASTARSAMQHHHRHAMGVAALLYIKVMATFHRQDKLVEWLDLGIQ